MMFLGIAERCNTLIKVVKLKRRFSRFFAVFTRRWEEEMNNHIHMAELGISEQERTRYLNAKPEINKQVSRLQTEARKRAKQPKCLVCGKLCAGFCKSHSVPRTFVKRIALDGKVYFGGLQKEIPFLGEDCGVGDAGTFFIICRDCDSRIFQKYENPATYAADKLSGSVLAQIAMKNFLQMISKRCQEGALNDIMLETHPFYSDIQAQIPIDLLEYYRGFNRAKLACAGHHEDWYHLFYYRRLDYVVPVAMQSLLSLVVDFEGSVVNNLFNMDPAYHIQPIHVAIFPLEKSSVILIFRDSREKRLRKFAQQLNRLEPDDQLVAINYLIFAYCENIFLSKAVDDTVFNDENFKKVCRKYPHFYADQPFDPLPEALLAYNLNERKSIPNLLSRRYALQEEKG